MRLPAHCPQGLHHMLASEWPARELTLPMRLSKACRRLSDARASRHPRVAVSGPPRSPSKSHQSLGPAGFEALTPASSSGRLIEACPLWPPPPLRFSGLYCSHLPHCFWTRVFFPLETQQHTKAPPQGVRCILHDGTPCSQVSELSLCCAFAGPMLFRAWVVQYVLR